MKPASVGWRNVGISQKISPVDQLNIVKYASTSVCMNYYYTKAVEFNASFIVTPKSKNEF